MASVQLTRADLKRTDLTRQQEAALRRINGIDLADIRDRAGKRDGWTAGQKRLAEKWYRGYLWLSYLHGKQPVFAIVAEADELWHAHIVYTKRYRRDCQRVFGEFLDHNPVHGIATKSYKASIARAERWYEAEFKQEFAVGGRPMRSVIQLIHVCF